MGFIDAFEVNALAGTFAALRDDCTAKAMGEAAIAHFRRG